MAGDEQTSAPDLETYGYADPYDHPDLPLPLRLIAVATDASAEDLRGVGEGDGAYDQVTGILADHGWRAHIAIANTMGLTGDWGVDDVVDAVTEALHEYQELRAELARVRPVVDTAREVAVLDLPVRTPAEARKLAVLVTAVAALDASGAGGPDLLAGYSGTDSDPELSRDMAAAMAAEMDAAGALGVDAAATPPPATAQETSPAADDMVMVRRSDLWKLGADLHAPGRRAYLAEDAETWTEIEAVRETVRSLAGGAAAPVAGYPAAARAGAFTEWGAKWSDGGYCPARPARSEKFARKHARQFGTRPIRRGVGPWVYADTGEPAFDEPAAPTTDTRPGGLNHG